MRRFLAGLAAFAALALGLGPTGSIAQAGDLTAPSGLRISWADADMVAPDGCRNYPFQWTNQGRELIAFWFYVGWQGYGVAMGQFAKIGVPAGATGTGSIRLCEDDLFNGLGPYNTFILIDDFDNPPRSNEGIENLSFRPAVTAPSAPVNVRAAAGDANATVSWSAPASDGGSPVTEYTVTSVPSSAGCTSSLPYCVVRGLRNGVPYAFTVTATNAAGTSGSSTPSIPVTPKAPVSLSLSCRAATSGAGPQASCTGRTTGLEPGTTLTVQTKASPRGAWVSAPRNSWPLVTQGSAFFWRSSSLQRGPVWVRVGHGGKWSNTANVRLR